MGASLDMAEKSFRGSFDREKQANRCEGRGGGLPLLVLTEGRHGMRNRLFALAGIVFVAMMLLRCALVFAQGVDDPEVTGPMWKPLLDMALKSLVPALWVAIGPVMVAAITKGVNRVSTVYVPRPVQVVLSGLFTAIVAGLTGDATAAMQAVGTGMGAQVLAATPPNALLTEKREG